MDASHADSAATPPLRAPSERAPDFGSVAAIYARHRADFPPEFFARLAAHGIGLPGQRVLDLACGAGATTLPLARRGVAVTALDVAAPMLDALAARAAESGVALAFHEARAEATGLPDAAFDVVVAAQCWHLLDAAAALAEVRRVLRPGGRLVVAYQEALALPGSIVAATQELLRARCPAYAPHADGTGFEAGAWRDLARAGGFAHRETFAFDVVRPTAPEAWIARTAASGPVLTYLRADAGEVEEFLAALRAEVAARWPDGAAPLEVTQRVVAMVADDLRPRDAELRLGDPPRWRGEVGAIHLAGRRGELPAEVAEAEAVAGIGLVGDRYHEQNARAAGRRPEPAGAEGSRSGGAETTGGGAPPDRHVTLIEEEAIAGWAVEATEDGEEHAGRVAALTTAASRRNVATRGVPLNHLVGRLFAVGEVVLRGERLCEPCGHLQQMTGLPVLKGLAHRGGLRAGIVVGGTIRPGDAIVPLT